MPHAVPAPRVPAVVPASVPARRVAPELSPAIRATLLAVCGIRTGAVVLDLTLEGSLVRPAGAAAGRSGVVLVAAPPALAETVPAMLRGAAITNAFAVLPGSRLLTVLRPLLRPGARVAVTAADTEAIQEAAATAGYDLAHVESEVDGLVVAGLRNRSLG